MRAAGTHPSIKAVEPMHFMWGPHAPPMETVPTDVMLWLGMHMAVMVKDVVGTLVAVSEELIGAKGMVGSGPTEAPGITLVFTKTMSLSP